MDSKQEFLEIFYDNVDREGADKLLEWLEKSDFFSAPASTRRHSAYKGGLCQHSINVYKRFVKLLEGEALTVEDFDEAIEWCRARKDRFGAFVTCGARDPDLPSFALRLSQAVE
jgi:hypothetical protein